MIHFNQETASQLLSTWQYKDIGVEKEFIFLNFTEAFAFMNIVASLCDEADHHPEWSNVYNRVHIRLNTHSENAVTQKDIDLALKIDQAFEGFNSKQ